MDLQKEREVFEKHIQTIAHPHRSPKAMFFTVNDGHGNIIYADSVIQDQWITWQAAIKHVVPEGFVLVPKEPTHEMWSGISRHLGRYMQMHNRYCPKTLKKYFDRFISEPPEWLTKEVGNWESDHAFATADLPVFIYKAMLEAQEQSND